MFEKKRLVEEQAEIDARLDGMKNAITEQQRSFTEAETKSFDDDYAKRQEYQGKIDTLERLERVKPVQRSVEPQGYHTFAPAKPVITQDERNRGLCGWALSGAGYKNRATTDMLRCADKCGYDGQSNAVEYSRAQSTTASEGGNLISGAAFSGLSEKLKYFGGVRQFVNVESSPTGRPFFWATTDNTARVTGAHSENVSDMTNTSTTFGKVTLNSYTQTSAIFPVSVEVLVDSEINLEAFLQRILLTSVGRQQNALGTNGLGSGSQQPNGLTTGGTNAVTAASATVITLNELYNLFFSVDKDYRDQDGTAWMFSDGTYNQIYQTLIDDDGRSLLWNSLNSLSDPGKLTILGKPVIINNDLPVMGTNASGHKTIIFGNGKLGYLWRDVGQPTVQVYRERYADQLAVGFQVYARFDGNVIDSTSYKCLTMHTGGAS